MRKTGLALGLLSFVLLSTSAFAADATSASCDLGYELPADISLWLPTSRPAEAQGEFDQLSWNTFLALNAPRVGAKPSLLGDNPTQWDRWSSTVDLIQCQNDPSDCFCAEGQCGSGDQYYPPACQAIPDFQNYRVLAQLSKIDDSFLEAGRGELSNHPVIDANGKFVRYEILLNPVAYDFVTDNRLYNKAGLSSLRQPIIFPCGDFTYQGGDPADPRMGAMVLKAAWMEYEDQSRATPFALGPYHTEEMLVFSPADRSVTGVASCEIKTMALIGMHIAHKTVRQPGWIWSTFEHRMNAPECTSLPPQGDQEGSGPNINCPTSVDRGYNLFAEECSDGAAGSAACQSCNQVPVSNSPDPQQVCTSSELSGGSSDNTGWCLDLPPAAEQGKSKLCRQVPLSVGYPTAHALNQSCAAQLGRQSVWSNYQLISTQWINQGSMTCQNGVAAPGRSREAILPQVFLLANGSEPQLRPYLANSSMESYGRSNCIGCHIQAAIKNAVNTKLSTDLMYWLQLEAFPTE